MEDSQIIHNDLHLILSATFNRLDQIFSDNLTDLIIKANIEHTKVLNRKNIELCYLQSKDDLIEEFQFLIKETRAKLLQLEEDKISIEAGVEEVIEL